MEEAYSKALKARGLLFQALKEWLKENHDIDPCEVLKGELEKETLKILKSPEKGAWYPASYFIEALKACSKMPSVPSECFVSFGGYLCHISLTTSFRGLIVFIDPVTLMRRIPLFWSRYFSGSNMRAEKISSSQASLSLAEPAGGKAICGMFTGWLKQALEMVKANEVKVTEGDYHWDVSWSWSQV